MNYLQIYNLSLSNYRRIVVHPPFFNPGEYYIIKETEVGLEFSRPTIDYRGRQLKAIMQGKTSNQLVIQLAADYPIGKYFFDEEESNEDKVVIKF